MTTYFRTGPRILKWLSSLPKPVGIMTAESRAAGFLVDCCRQLKLRVPKDVQTIGIDGADDSLMCNPPLTSIEMPGAKIGEVALKTLRDLLRGKETPPFVRIPGSSLVIRGSTGLVPVGLSTVSASIRQMQSPSFKGMSVGRLAEKSGVSRATFYRRFSAAGQAPARHLRRLRLEEACRMLRETDDTVTHVAQACGFKDLIAFSKFFKREMGAPPGTYRKRIKGHA